MSLKDSIRIMVVDDMSTSRGLLMNALEEIGIKNTFFENNGDAAFKALATNTVHLIISDHNMPKMTGLELLQNVRNYPKTSKVGFILVSGTPDAATIETASKFGLNNFLKKPFNTAQLRQCIERVTGPL